MLHQQLTCTLLLEVQHGRDLFVEDSSGLVAVFASAAHQVFAEEHVLLAAPRHWTNALAHAPLAHHVARNVGGLLEVVGGAAVEVTEHDHLGNAAAHGLTDGVFKVLA